MTSRKEKKRKTDKKIGGKLDNGYPFRDDMINFTLLYKGEEYYLEFPVLTDKSFVIREIKTRTGVRGNFCLQWQDDERQNTTVERTVTGRPQRFVDVYKENKGEKISIHSSYLTTLALTRFCGKTLKIISGRDAANILGRETFLSSFSQESLSDYNRKIIEQRRKPFDCPP